VLSLEAIDVADDPHEPFMVMAWEMRCAASPLYSGATDEAREAFAHMEQCLEHNDDREDWWNLIEAMDSALNVDLTAFARLRARARAVEAVVAAPTLRWHTSMVDGHATAADGGDLSVAAEHYRESLRWATAAGDTLAEVQSRRALAMAAAGLGAPDAAILCLEALRMSHSVRLWQKTWQILDDVALALAKSGDLDGAAVVLGHLDGHIPSYGMELNLGCRLAADALTRARAGDAERLAAWRRRGEGLNDVELVAFAEGRLAALAGRPA
jgi:hypothetical protein